MGGEGSFFRALRRVGLDLVFPRSCGVCRGDLSGDDQSLCGPCQKNFPRWTGLACRVCGTPLPDGGARCAVCRGRRRSFRFCRSAGLYEGSLRQAILLFKYGRREEIAVPLGECLAETFRSRPELHRAERVVPVPLHFIKRHARGFNQSERLARVFAGLTGLRLESDLLVRHRWTWAQAGLGKEKRKTNVQGAFVVRHPEGIKNQRVLLIDDVCTTGATLESCARALKEAGAVRVDALTLARDVETQKYDSLKPVHVQRARGGT
ncbi:MAG: ComF family protein [Elusimicrobia bacterium]|nr:ComF family protein [Elusimicrobiota bacterium]